MTRLAEILHVELSTLSIWESGRRRPPNCHMQRLARALRLQDDAVTRLFDNYPPNGSKEREPLHSLRRVRVQQGLTQRRLAALAGVSISTVQAWEHSGAPRERHEALAVLLGVEVKTLRQQGRPSPQQEPRPELAAMRRSAGMSQRQVAHAVGVSHKRVRKLEAAQSAARLPEVVALARLYRRPFRSVAAATHLLPSTHVDRRRWRSADLPAIIREVRRHRGETAKAVAIVLGVNPETFRRWERGTRWPSYEQLSVLDRYWHLSGDLSCLLADGASVGARPL